MARRPDDRPQKVANFASKMMREAKKEGFSGLELRSVANIFSAMVDAVPENAPAKRLDEYGENGASIVRDGKL